jgi:hypothetical protein
MQIFSNQESQVVTGGIELLKYLEQSRAGMLHGSFTTPTDTGAKTQLAKYLGEIFLRGNNAKAFIAIRGWSAWPSQTNFDLFDRYRASYGEDRRLIDSPVHYFSKVDQDAFVTILSLCLYFLWDAEIVGLESALQLSLSHDEVMGLFASDPNVYERISTMLLEHGCEEPAGV